MRGKVQIIHLKVDGKVWSVVPVRLLAVHPECQTFEGDVPGNRIAIPGLFMWWVLALVWQYGLCIDPSKRVSWQLSQIQGANPRGGSLSGQCTMDHLGATSLPQAISYLVLEPNPFTTPALVALCVI
jgi:hypothetical protein